MTIRYARSYGDNIGQMRDRLRKTPLYALGDCILVWVNEGDWWGSDIADLEMDDVERAERAEYARLKAKFEHGS